MSALLWLLFLNGLCLPMAVLGHRRMLQKHPEWIKEPAQGVAFRHAVIAAGVLWVVGSAGAGLWGFTVWVVVYHAIFLGAQVAVYLAFFCVSESGRRYYLLVCLHREPGLTESELAERYPNEGILARRLERLLAWGVVRRVDAGYLLVKRSSYHSARFFYIWGRILGFRWFPHRKR